MRKAIVGYLALAFILSWPLVFSRVGIFADAPIWLQFIMNGAVVATFFVIAHRVDQGEKKSSEESAEPKFEKASDLLEALKKLPDRVPEENFYADKVAKQYLELLPDIAECLNRNPQTAHPTVLFQIAHELSCCYIHFQQRNQMTTEENWILHARGAAKLQAEFLDPERNATFYKVLQEDLRDISFTICLAALNQMATSSLAIAGRRHGSENLELIEHGQAVIEHAVDLIAKRVEGELSAFLAELDEETSRELDEQFAELMQLSMFCKIVRANRGTPSDMEDMLRDVSEQISILTDGELDIDYSNLNTLAQSLENLLGEASELEPSQLMGLVDVQAKAAMAGDGKAAELALDYLDKLLALPEDAITPVSPINRATLQIMQAKGMLNAVFMPQLDDKLRDEYVSRADALFEKALQVRTRENMPQQFAAESLHRAIILSHRSVRAHKIHPEDRMEVALNCLDDCLGVIDDVSNSLVFLTANKFKAEIHYLRGEYAHVFDICQTIDRSLMSMLVSAPHTGHRNMLVAVFSELTEIHGMARLHVGDFLTAIAVIEKGKSRKWREFVAVETRQSKDEHVLALYNDLAQLRDQYTSITIQSFNTEEERLAASRERRALNSRIRLLTEKLENQLDLKAVDPDLDKQISNVQKQLRRTEHPVVFVFYCRGESAFVCVQKLGRKLKLDGRVLDGEQAAALKSVVHYDGAGSWKQAYARFRRALISEDELEAYRGAVEWNLFLHDALKLLWSELMQPISDALLRLGADIDETITFIPGGAYSNLPLHSAAAESEGRWDGFADRFNSAYLPSLSHIQTGKQPDVFSRPVAISADLVDDAEMEYQPPLNPLLVSSLNGTENVGPDAATVSKVKSVLEDCTCVSILAHGTWIPTKPEASYLSLSGGNLSIQELGRVQMKGKPLVLLGACESGGIGGPGQEYEAVGFPARFLECGARGVIATQWPVLDLAVSKIYGGTIKSLVSSESICGSDALRQFVLSVRNHESESLDDGRHLFLSAPAKPIDIGSEAERRDINGLNEPIHWAGIAYFGVR